MTDALPATTKAKILGEALIRGIATAGGILLSTGRISSEMLRKGAHMRTPFVISRTSPTSLAIQAAKLGKPLAEIAKGSKLAAPLNQLATSLLDAANLGDRGIGVGLQRNLATAAHAFVGGDDDL